MAVLFVSSSFFGYAKKISNEIEGRLGQVYWYEDRPSIGFWGKVLARLFPRIIEFFAFRYFSKIAKGLQGAGIDNVFVIKGESLSVRSIKMLRKTFPDAVFRIYFWDSYKNMPVGSRDKVEFFDHAFSFDPCDVAADDRLKYRPLFYVEDYSRIASDVPRDIDLLFVGTAHSDRYRLVKKVESALPPGTVFHYVLYCQRKFIYYVRKAFDPRYKGAGLSDFVFSPISSAEISSLVARSKAILDIERSVQAGLTMRTLEVLGAKRKLITTNPTVVDADFYIDSNILVIDRDKPSISENFFLLPWCDVDVDVSARYSIKRWVDEIFSS